MTNNRKWGQDATFLPGWKRVGQAAYNSAVSPLTWAPAVGAAVFQVGKWDKNVAKWASDKTPVFGSQRNADSWSNYLLYASGALYGGTALLTPSGDQPGNWVTNKIKGFIVTGAAFGLSEGVTATLNATIGRTTPGGFDNAFPSMHTTAVTAFSTLAAKNVEAMELPKTAEVAADIGLGAIAVGTAWARVEANMHYPSDILAGFAIGHFFSSFVNDAFLGLQGVSPEVDVSRHGFNVGVTWSF